MFANAAARLAKPSAAVAAATFASSAFVLRDVAEAKAVKVDEKAIRCDIAELIDSDSDKRSDGTSLTGTFVRLAWHCAGTYSKQDNTGGSQGGRQRFDPEASIGANAGLKMARDALEPIKSKYPQVSYADIFTLSGVVAIENAGGPTVPFRFGREDATDGSTSPPDGRLPDADKGSPPKTIEHIRVVFDRMGFNDREMVALLGAHALGRCHTNASGYWGPWTRAENTMSNEYFRLLVEENWKLKKTHEGKQWMGPEQYEDKTGALMMLPADIALIQDPVFRGIVGEFAKDEEAFFKEFSGAFSRLLELGVNTFPAPWWKVWAR